MFLPNCYIKINTGHQVQASLLFLPALTSAFFNRGGRNS
jgi:hypothetical protein